ncbi:MAG: hypothetical protein ACRDCD_02540 [Mycoplasmoidaceae bacterium]
MKKIIKLSLLGTLITTSALAITLPIVSCSSSVEENVVEEDYSTNNDLLGPNDGRPILPNIVKDFNTKEVTNILITELKKKLTTSTLTEFLNKYKKGEEFFSGDYLLELIQENLKLQDRFDNKDTPVLFDNVVNFIEVIESGKRTTASIFTLPTIKIHLKDDFECYEEIIIIHKDIIDLNN